MQKLLVHVLASMGRILSANKAHGGTAAPQTFRPRQVGRSGAPQVHLRILSPAERRKLSPLLSASLGTIVVAGFSGAAMAQGEESCAFVYQLRSPYTVERVLRQFPNDPCIPELIEALSPRLLSRISLDLIANLPASQLRLVSQDVLDDLGITTRGVRRPVVEDNANAGGAY